MGAQRTFGFVRMEKFNSIFLLLSLASALKIIIYKSNQMSSQRKAEKIRLYEFSPGGCAKGREVEYSIGIVVPSVPPTDLTASSVCRVKYEIMVSERESIEQRCFHIQSIRNVNSYTHTSARRHMRVN